jgi:hypothetical protein
MTKNIFHSKIILIIFKDKLTIIIFHNKIILIIFKDKLTKNIFFTLLF